MASPDRPSSRRWFLASLVVAPAVLSVAARGKARAQELAAAPEQAPPEALVCSAEDDEATRASFAYVDISPYGAEKDCRNCEFWIPVEAGASCGGCTLISGPISPLGYCDIWALAGQMAAEGGLPGSAVSN